MAAIVVQGEFEMVSRPMNHTETTFTQFPVLTGTGPALNLGPMRGMREPGTQYWTYITAGGPRTIDRGPASRLPGGARG